jgi:hypothetical protein
MELNHILREHNLSVRGILSPETARNIGRIAGVDALIVGNVQNYRIERWRSDKLTHFCSLKLSHSSTHTTFLKMLFFLEIYI